MRKVLVVYVSPLTASMLTRSIGIWRSGRGEDCAHSRAGDCHRDADAGCPQRERARARDGRKGRLAGNHLEALGSARTNFTPIHES